eukprot:IDg6538t1
MVRAIGVASQVLGYLNLARFRARRALQNSFTSSRVFIKYASCVTIEFIHIR